MGTGGAIASGALSGAATGAMVGGPYGAIIGGVAGALAGIFGGSEKPKLQPLHLQDVTAGQDEALKQKAGLPGVANTVKTANDLANEDYRRRIEKLSPGILETVDRLGIDALSLLKGKVPGGDVTARDLGLTEFDLEKLGASGDDYARKMATSLNPSNATVYSTLVSPAAALARRDAQDVRNNQIANQGAVQGAAAASVNPLLAGATSFLGGLGKSDLTKSDPFGKSAEYIKGLFGPGTIG